MQHRESARLTFGALASDLYEGVNVQRMRAERTARVRAVMRARGIPSLLVTGADTCRYLVGFWWSEFQPQSAYVLFFAEHDPVVFANPGMFQQMPDQAPWLPRWRIARSWLNGLPGEAAAREEAGRFAEEVKDELAAHKLQNERFGVVDFDILSRESLVRCGLNVEDAASVLLEASAVKTADEISCLKLSASISAAAFSVCLNDLRPGITHLQLAGRMEHALADAGAEVAVAGVTSGPLSFEQRMAGANRLIEYGDLVYAATCGTSFMGYTACLYRTYVCGRRPSPAEEDWHRRLRDRLDRVIAALKPGSTTADVASEFAPAQTWGYASEAEVLTVEIAHGLGLVNLGSRSSHYNLPIINRQWSLEHPQPIEAGMVIAVEGLEGVHRAGGVRLENMVLVTDDGAELLDRYPDDLLVAV